MSELSPGVFFAIHLVTLYKHARNVQPYNYVDLMKLKLEFLVYINVIVEFNYSLMRKYDPFQPVYAILIPEYNVSNYFEKSPD